MFSYTIPMREVENLTLNGQTFRIGFAETEAEVLLAQRLRYDVFFLEEGDERYADHAVKTFGDERDRRSRIVVALDDGGVCAATLRLSLRRDGPFIGDHGYPYSKVCARYGADQASIAVAERAVVWKERRGIGLFVRVFRFAESWLVRQGVRVCVGVVLERKPAVALLVERLGFALIEESEVVQGGPWRYYAKGLGEFAKG